MPPDGGATGRSWVSTNKVVTNKPESVSGTPTRRPVVVRPTSHLPVSVRLPESVDGDSRGGEPARVVRTGESAGPWRTVTECSGRSMNVVAHEDDDLLFINPSVSEDLAGGRCVVTVYVTAGDAGRGRGYWMGREQGARDAYAAMTGDAGWKEDTPVVRGRSVARFTLGNGRATLIFLRLPDAHTSADRPQDGLRRVWSGELAAVRTVDDGERYGRVDLIGALAMLMSEYRPDEIRTLDYAGRYGDGDHDDHHTVGYLAEAAQRAYGLPHRISGYLGYNVAKWPANLTDDVRDAKLGYFLAYAPHDRNVCQTAAACLGNFYAPRFSHRIVTAEG